MFDYKNSLQYLQAELSYVDALLKSYLRRQSLRHNALTMLQWEEIAGWLAEAPEDPAALRQQIDAAAAASQQQGVELRLQDLVARLQLTDHERDILLLALAPALDSRYHKLYAYAQEDIQGHQPRLGFIINVLRDRLDEQWVLQSCVSKHAPLVRYGLVDISSARLHEVLNVPERLLEYMLGNTQLDSRLQGMVESGYPAASPTPCDPAVSQRLQALSERYLAASGSLYLHVQGEAGTGKCYVAVTLAQFLQLPLLTIDTPTVLAQNEVSFGEFLQLLQRELLLGPSVCYWRRVDSLLATEQAGRLRLLQRYLDRQTLPQVLGGRQEWQPQHWPKTVSMVLAKPDFSARQVLWQQITAQAGLEPAPVLLKNLAQRFQFTPGQIQAAVQAAEQLQQGQPLELEETLYRACRLQSQHHLGRLAQRVSHSRYGELILPPEAQSQLDELIAYLMQYEQVFDTWGFNKKLTRGKGLAALFTGPPGTGKTLAAEVIAANLKLELYKIDLSAVVNKYIGETEKHLGAIFDEAAQADVALFFDEADALFGKRSEVQSSHDRYANLETNYLLQKLEAHPGVVILASNYKSNIDEAFIRRLQFCIDFPLPNEQERLRIWEHIWPVELPLSSDVDLKKLAKELELAGGHIRNISLNAAFKAAQEGATAISWGHIQQAAYRELKKTGRMVQISELLT